MTWIGGLHFGLALAALSAGLVVVLARKGTRFHRRAGNVYVATMIGVNGTAFLLYRLLGHFGPFHVAAVFSLITVLAGWIPVVRKSNKYWLRAHAYWMSGSYVGLWAAAMAETTSRLSLLPFWWMVAAASSAVGVAGFVLVVRFVPGAIQNLRGRPAS